MACDHQCTCIVREGLSTPYDQQELTLTCGGLHVVKKEWMVEDHLDECSPAVR